VRVLESVGLSDDSIDVEDSSSMVVGSRYVLYDPDTHVSEAFTLKAILTQNRILSDAPLTFQSWAGSNSVVTQNAWSEMGGEVRVFPGQMLLTRYTNVAEYVDQGRLLIVTRTPEASFSVLYRKGGDTEWKIAEYLGVEEAPGMFLHSWAYLGHDQVRFQLEAQAEAVVDHMCLYTTLDAQILPWVRVPLITGTFSLRRFGALYGAGCQTTEVQLSDDPDFLAGVQTADVPGELGDGLEADISDALAGRFTLESGVTYYWRARQRSTDDKWSLWSQPGSFTAE
jgi:hypothetical protein